MAKTHWYRIGFNEGSSLGGRYLPPMPAPGRTEADYENYRRGFNDSRRLHGGEEMQA